MSEIIKQRYWTFLIYPDSVSSDWEDVIVGLGLKYSVSPLHDRDLFPDGGLKKPHHHIIVAFNGPTTYENVRKVICAPINATTPKPVLDIGGLYDYHTHRHHPDKAQYSASDIRDCNGFVIDNLIASSDIAREDDVFSVIEDLIIENNITEFIDLIIFLRTYRENIDKGLFLLSFVRHNVYYFKEIVKSNMYRHTTSSFPGNGEGVSVR